MSASRTVTDGLLHPVALCGVALLLVNDHWLKGAFPGVVTGKLSDVAGLAFFPLLLQAAVELAQPAFGARFDGPSRKILLGACVATALAFSLVKLGVADRAYAVAWGAMQWPFRALAAWVHGAPVPSFAAVQIVADPTDLVALPSVVLAYLAGSRR